MKILYLVHQFYPEFQAGTEKFVLNCALMAQKNGNKVKVITYGSYEHSFFDVETNGILSKEFTFEGIPVLALKIKDEPFNLHFSLDNNLLNKIAEQILLDEAPDLVHVGHPMRIYPFIRGIKVLRIPYVITLTDFFLICPKVILAPNANSLCSGPQKGAACKHLCNELSETFITDRLHAGEKLLRGADALISPSKFLANIFNDEYKALKIQVNNHGIRYQHIRPNDKRYSQNSPIVFGYAGGLIYHKGVHVLIKAFTSIKSDKVRLIIYGSGLEDYIGRLNELAKGDNRISFRGPYLPDQLREIYQEIDVMVTPSVCYENYPFVLHESLASNVPVIASLLGGMAERIKDGYNGYTFQAGNHADLQRIMEIIIEKPESLNKLKQNIRESMIIPNIEQEAYKYLKIYNFLFNSK